MKILIYSPSFYPNIGGIEILTLNLAKAFKLFGHEVVVLTKSISDGSSTEINIIYKPVTSEFVKYYSWCDVFYLLNLSLKICWLMLLNPFKKWVVSHNTWYFNPEQPNYILATIKQLFLFKVTNISVSNILAKSIWAKSIVIHNCYNNNLFKNLRSVRSRDFLFVGRLVSSKGCVDLIEAFKTVLESYPNSKLSVVGNGPEESLIRNKVNELKIDNSVDFLGPKSQVDIGSIMNEHKCLVVPSVGTEAFGIVVLEGLACGCMILSSDSTGLVEAGDKFSIQFQARNVTEMAAQMKLILNDDTNINFSDEELVDYLKIHNVKYIAEKYLNLFP